MIIDQKPLSRREALALFSAAGLSLGLSSSAIGQVEARPNWTPPSADRELFIRVRGGRIWARINGKLEGPKAPVLMAHGGPGGNHVSFLPGTILASERAVI